MSDCDKDRVAMDACEAWKNRFKVYLICQDCDRVFEVDRSTLHLSTEQTAQHTRMLVIPVSETCWRCANLKVARSEPDTRPSGMNRWEPA